MTNTEVGAKRLGFYLHTGWDFEYPFAVRSWTNDDHANFYTLLRQMGFNLLMYWPIVECMPPPLSDQDRHKLVEIRKLADTAHALGLQFWFAFCPNVTSRPEIAGRPFEKRHLYPFKIEVRLDDENACADYMRHRREILSVLNNADAYVTIDGDPGGYAGAKLSDFWRIMHGDRATIDEYGTHPTAQKLIAWPWKGWGSDWETNGAWNEPLEPLVGPFLRDCLQNLPEPWELLPGRHYCENRGNGRLVLDMTDRVGLLARSTLMLYEIVELEPTPPAPVLQFDYIRTVMRQEATLADAAKGIMGNAQEPILVLPNIWLFANAAQNPAYLDLDDCTILSGLAGFLGGDPDVLVPAWRSMYLNLHDIPADLPEKLRGARLQAESAGLIPGGPQRYLDIMAEFVDSRLRILRACGRSPSSRDDIRITLRESVEALRDWWNVHKYVFDGATTGFSIDFTHDGLKRPIAEYLQSNVCETDVAELAVQLVDDCALSIEESRSIVHW